MATSGVTSYSITGDEIIKLAMLDIGALAIGEEPSFSEYTDARQRLNLFLKSLQTKFKFISSTSEETISTVADTATYAIEAGTDQIEGIWLEVDDTILHIDLLSDPAHFGGTATGLPTIAFIDETTSPFTLNLYPIPDAVYTVHYQKTSVLETIIASTDEVDLPVKFVDMIVKGLAYRLAPSYRVPLNERMLLQSEYSVLEREALADNTYRTGDEIVIPAFVV